MEKEAINRLIRDWSGIDRDDFDHDLNAMHEAESKLTFGEQVKGYCSELLHTKIKVIEDGTAYEIDLFEEYGWYGLIRATADQRAEALLRTIGRWKD